jgi:hypothetical protein
MGSLNPIHGADLISISLGELTCFEEIEYLWSCRFVVVLLLLR